MESGWLFGDRFALSGTTDPIETAIPSPNSRLYDSETPVSNLHFSIYSCPVPAMMDQHGDLESGCQSTEMNGRSAVASKRWRI